jgi:CheY-like chemotaxis protein
MSPGETLNVLVVEDSADQAQLLRHHLQGAGCHVALVDTAEDAIIAYQSRRFDLAVVDLRLPGMDGWELVGHMQRDRPELVIAVTSVLDRKEYPDVPWALPKPFTKAQVHHVLAGVTGTAA